MANFSSTSETDPLKIKLAITWRRIQPGLKNQKKSRVIETEFQPGLKSELGFVFWETIYQPG